MSERRFCPIENTMQPHRGRTCLSCHPDAVPDGLHPALAEELDMFAPQSAPEPDPFEDPLLAEFRAYEAANPHLLPTMERIARALIADGRKRIGAKEIFERLRYDDGYRFEGEPFRLDNRFAAGFARRLLEVAPDLEQYVERRRSRFDGLAA